MMFSIIIPTYNRADFIEKTIHSALTQTFANFEVIIIDDGSTDSTEETINAINDDRINYFKKENEERGAARNYGILKASGEYITFLDSDDILYPNYLEEAKIFIEKNSSPSFFFQAYNTIDVTGQILSNSLKKYKDVYSSLISKGNFIACQGVFVRKEVISNNLFNPDRELSGSEDYELWLRLGARVGIQQNLKITSALVEHDNRSVVNFAPKVLIRRKELMLHYLFKDDFVSNKLIDRKKKLYSGAYSYISLHLALAKYKKESIVYLFKALRAYPASIFKNRFLATIKQLLL